MMLIRLQLPSVHHNLSCDGASTCARDAEERKDNAKREFGQQNVGMERLGTIYTRGGQTCSVYEPPIVIPKLVRAAT